MTTSAAVRGEAGGITAVLSPLRRGRRWMEGKHGEGLMGWLWGGRHRPIANWAEDELRRWSF